VKLLFDQNLSPRLVDSLADIFPASLHVQSAGLDRALDDAVWTFAAENGYMVVTKDSDFQERGQVAASGPKVIWIRRGNCTTMAIEAMLRNNLDRIEALECDKDAGFLILF
jgi:predicted nuclease of predicted toxin-antitoxin system